MAFVKLDCGALDSSLWAEPSDVVKVFFTMLLMCNSEGLCASTAPGIASRANLPVTRVREILAHLESPDVDDRSGVDEGRRIKRVPGGYQLTNYLSYRNKDHNAIERARRYRERIRAALVTRDGVTRTRDVTAKASRVTEAEAEAEAETVQPVQPSSLHGKEGESAERGNHAPANPLLTGRRPKLEMECYRLIREINELEPDKDPTEILLEATSWETHDGRARAKCRIETLTDDHLIHTHNDLKSILADAKSKRAKAAAEAKRLEHAPPRRT